MSNCKVFYWNSADDREHTHKRIELGIENEIITVYNIKIAEKLFKKVKENDYILVYEPKYHKKSKIKYDGYCIDCICEKNDGLQAFTHIFKIIKSPIKLSSYDEEANIGFNIIINTWKRKDASRQYTFQELEEYKYYCKDYYKTGNIKYIFPVQYISKFMNPIYTYSNKSIDNTYYYNKSIIKGFNEIFCCGCNDLENCKNNQCIYYHINQKLQL